MPAYIPRLVAACALAVTLTLLTLGAQGIQSQAPARAVLPAPAATLEVQRFSGDFAEWGAALTVQSPQTLTFRWGTKNQSVTSGVWQVSDQPFPISDTSPHLAKVVTFGSLPQTVAGRNPTQFTIDFAQILKGPPPAIQKRYYVRAVPMKGPAQPVGRLFPIVTITYAKAPPGTTFQFDTLNVVSVGPSGGTLQGPPESMKTLDTTNSIEIGYSYELNTEDAAEIRQWLLVEGGGVAPNNFWFSRAVKKGKGTVKNRATIKCASAGQKPTVIKAIDYKLIRLGTVLAEGTRPVSGLTFTCPGGPPAPSGYLKIASVSPGSGTIYGPHSGQSMTTNNSVLIAYEYEYVSSAAADVRQWALRENGMVEALNVWTFAPVTKGKHTAETRLTVTCETANQRPRAVKGIKYGIYPKDGSAPLYETVKPVNLTFRCK